MCGRLLGEPGYVYGVQSVETPRMPRTLRWCLVVPVYFGVVVYSLRDASPGSYCAYCGPSPGFWWGDPTTLPGPHEYLRNKTYYDFLFLLPYLAAGLVMTVCGCIAYPSL